LLHGDGPNGGTAITDSSGNHNPSVVNKVLTSAAQSKFGGASLSFIEASSSWLGFSESADWHISSGSDFTYDFWVFPVSMPTYGLGVCGTLTMSNVGSSIALRGSYYGNNGQVAFFTNGNWQAVSSAAVPLNAWTHIAVVRYQGVVSIYINGVQSGTKYTGSCTDSGSGFSVGDQYTQGNYLSNWGFNGYIDEFRFSNGVARWTSNFTPPTCEYGTSAPGANFSASVTSGTAPLTVQFTDTSIGTVTSWSWSFGDGGTSNSQNPNYIYSTPGTYTVSLTATGPNGSNTNTQTNYINVSAEPPPIPGIDQYTKLLLHGDGANGGTAITDASGNHNPSVVNNVVTSTTQSKFGGASLSFAKASTSWLGFAESADWHISSGSDFTYDFWVFPLSMPTYGLGVCGTLNSRNGGNGIALRGANYGNNGQVAFMTNGAWQAVSSAAVPLNAWTHIAVVRYQGVVSIYINGVQSGTTFTGSCGDSDSGFSIGDTYTQGNSNHYWNFNGYIDEFRFSNGVARWTTNFTPPTSEYGN
jgi:PKD repeat protein